MRCVSVAPLEAPLFYRHTVVGDALRKHPKVRWVFAAWHVGGCHSCSRADDETLEELARGYGLDLERFLADLNSL